MHEEMLPKNSTVYNFIRQSARIKNAKSRKEKIESIYNSLILMLVASSILVVFLLNLSNITTGHWFVSARAAGQLQDLAFDSFIIPTLLITSTAALALGWALRSVGPISAPKEMLYWVFQNPVDRNMYLAKRRAATVAFSISYALVSALVVTIPLSIQSGYGIDILGVFTFSVTACVLVLVFALNAQHRTALTEVDDQVPSRTLPWPSLEKAAGQSKLLEVALFSLEFAAFPRMLFSAKSSDKYGSHAFAMHNKARPYLAIINTEWLTWVRCRGVVPALLILCLVAILLALSPLSSVPLFMVVSLISLALAASSVASVGVKHSEGNPHRYSMLPVDEMWEKLTQLLVPVMVSTVWFVITFGIISMLSGFPASMFGIIATGVGLGAAGVYGSDRKPPNWGGDAFLSTPLGPIPVMSVVNLFKGYGLTILVVFPALLLVFGVGNPWIMGCACIAVSAFAVWASARRQR